MLTGLTTQSATALIPLARSWISPPDIAAPAGVDIAYAPAQRAFTIHGNGPAPLTLQVEASDDRPLVDPAFVFDDWHGTATVTVDGHAVDGARLGYVKGLTSTRLIVYLPLRATKPTTVTITPSS